MYGEGQRRYPEHGRQRLAGRCFPGAMNSLFAIAPYKYEGMWVFDDPQVGLRREPFVSGADAIIDVLTADIPDAEHGFKLIFSAHGFPGSSARFVWDRSDFDGNWYRWPEKGMEGWLCPALLRYFETAPKKLYAQFRPLPR